MQNKKELQPFTIGIVGIGYAGAAMLAHLLEKFQDALNSGKIEIYAFEKGNQSGPGMAWNKDINSDCQLSNLPVKLLRLSDSFKPSFQKWLLQKHNASFKTDSCLEAAYVPRRFFGEYLCEMVQELSYKKGIFVHNSNEVIAIHPGKSKQYILNLQSQQQIEVDSIVLCTGASHSGGNIKFSHLLKKPNYLDTPWPASKLKKFICGSKNIAIIGTGLTAVDVVKHIAKLDSKPPIVMTSRHARFNPVVRNLRSAKVSQQSPYKCKVLTPQLFTSLPAQLSFEQCVDFIQKEIEACIGTVDWQKLLNIQDGVKEWRKHVAIYHQEQLCRWQLAIIEIDAVFPQLWQRLNDHERLKWQASSFKTVYQNYSNPLPVESPQEILAMIDQGRISVLQGLDTIEALPDGFLLHFKKEKSIDVSHCINCTGVSFDVNLDPSPLMQQLLSGLAQAHPFGGIYVATNTFEIDKAKNIYVIGHKAKGSRYLTSGLGFILAMVGSVMRDIEKRCAK